MNCNTPRSWYHYGCQKEVNWSIMDWVDGTPLATIVIRPTFLGRIRWQVLNEANTQIGCLKAGIEWSTFSKMLGSEAIEQVCGDLIATGLTTIAEAFGDDKKVSGHSGSLWIGGGPICAMSWSASAVALRFVCEEPTLYQRQVVAAVSVLLAYSPDYYKRA